MKKNRVGLMTWYTYQNYGTVLQATALYRKIADLGYEPSLIGYDPKGNRTEPRIGFLMERAWDKAKNFRNIPYSSNEKTELFSAFLHEKTSSTDHCRSFPELYELNSSFDAFVCGSDQIWSPLCYDDKYFLSFVENTKRMVAYAPSMGTNVISDSRMRQQIAEYLSRFEHLSVREEQGAALIRELTGKNAKVVLDPTLLLTSSDWNCCVPDTETTNIGDKEYIVCYFLGNADRYMRYVRALSQKLKVPFYVIPVTKRQKRSENAVPFEVGPGEFVSLIRNAKYVCTDSFHGMAFSINYNIPFSIFKRFSDNDSRNQNGRVYHLLKRLNLENRLTDPNNTRIAEETLSCDFKEANTLLAEERRFSEEYLKQSLAQAVGAEEKNTEVDSYTITHLCCGCGACTTVCPKGAVTVSQNEEGFEHYRIDNTQCVRCGKCKTVCPMARIIAPEIKAALGLYSVKSTSEQVLQHSASGGVGHELAKYCLAGGKHVFGCAYDSSSNSAKHIVIAPSEPEKLSLLQGSKYIQSVSAGALQQIGETIKDGEIAFFGTPCQVAAVDKLLRQKGKREQAVLVDLICHGVPSYHLWEKYIRDTDRKHNTGMNPAVLFRSQGRDWHKRHMHIEGNGYVREKDERRDDFYAFFRRGLCDMASCSDCPYREKSAADLRIGDYWGSRFEKDKQGVSMVIANTSAGVRLLQDLADSRICQVEKHDLSEYWTVQYPYNSYRPLVREQLIAELREDGKSLSQLRKEYCSFYDTKEKIGRLYYKVKRLVK